MDSINKTLYIPLYGKAYVSRRGLLLQDSKAEAIWAAEGFPLKGKARSKWLAYNMGMRAAVFDRWLEEQLRQHPDAVILHLGCGMDSRCSRVDGGLHLWLDVDFPEVIAERRRYYEESQTYRMIPADIRDSSWLGSVPRENHAIILMEGVSMYLTMEELRGAIAGWTAHFPSVSLLMDSYTTFAARATKYKNPINEVGVTQVHGFDDPLAPTEKTGLQYVREWDLTPDDLILRLPKGEQRFFRVFFAGSFARKIYRLFEYAALSPS